MTTWHLWSAVPINRHIISSADYK